MDVAFRADMRNTSTKRSIIQLKSCEINLLKPSGNFTYDQV
jgi:hypothetical protein